MSFVTPIRHVPIYICLHSETKVTKSRTELHVEKDIIRLEVSVDELLRVHESNSRSDFSRHTNSVFYKSNFFVEIFEELGQVVLTEFRDDESPSQFL